MVFQFGHATVIVSHEHSKATGKVMPKLEIQAIDAYRYQREYTLQYRHRPGNSKDCYWESHAYKHPGQRHIVEISTYSTAAGLFDKIVEYCEKYPALLFNDDSREFRARHEGFVHFHDMLLAGAAPSVTLL